MAHPFLLPCPHIVLCFNFDDMRTEDASVRLHLSLVNLVRNYENPNSGVYTFDERALGKGTWIVIIDTGVNWEQFPEVITASNSLGNFGFICHPGKRLHI